MSRNCIAVAALITIPFASGAGQAPDSTRVEPYDRSEVAATALAYVGPGLGHFYAGENKRGAFILGTGSLAIVGVGWMIADGLSNVLCGEAECVERSRSHLQTQGALIGVGFAAWLWGVYDAHRAIQRQRKIHSATRSSNRDLGLLVAPRALPSEVRLGLRFAP
ncbi:MAG: hypothetical protein ACT4P6_04665 [Gemmatimonadaceae bacterium]